MVYLKNFLVFIQNGKIGFKNPYHESLWNKFLKQFEGKKGWITFEEDLGKRSDRQNRFYWLYINIIADTTGFTPSEVHEWAKNRFLRESERMVLGDKINLTKSTTELNKLEFGEYIDKICEATGIPPPDASIFNLAPFK